MREALFVDDPRLSSFELSADHPFRPERLAAVADLLRATELLHDDEVVGLDPFDEAELTRVHDPEYLEVVRAGEAAGAADLWRHGLGTPDTPLFPAMHENVSRVVAASVTAVEAVASGRARRAASFSGGLHHAMRGHASGFCIYDDAAVAIERARREHGLRVAYLDLDAHHGDGVQAAFYAQPEVLTVSLHESGRTLFPGTGFVHELGEGPGLGASLNVPLEPYADDAALLEAFDRVVPAALEAFAPDLIVLQAGADGHREDPLAHLAYTVGGMSAAYARVAALADALAGGRLVVLGGGGYRPFTVVPRAWTHAWAAATGRTVPEHVPEAWRARWARRAGSVRLPERFADEAEYLPDARAWQATLTVRRARATAEALHARLAEVGGVPTPR